MLITIFLVSLGAILLMLLVKLYEVKRQKESFIKKVLSRFDKELEEKYQKTLNSINKVWQERVVTSIGSSPQYARSLREKLSTLIENTYNSSLPNIRGTIKFAENQKLSLYLKEIYEHKEKNGKGRIEG